MASTKGTSEDFPGAYSGQGRSWELKTKKAIELLPDKYGFQPKVVLSARAPPTITATAVDVPMHERAQYGSAYIAVSVGAGQITPRKLAASLNTPAATVGPLRGAASRQAPLDAYRLAPDQGPSAHTAHTLRTHQTAPYTPLHPASSCYYRILVRLGS